MVKLFGKIPLPQFGINFTKSEFFEKMARKSFDDVDVDKDGALDFKELYLAILKLFDLLNKKLPCHLRIPNTQEMTEMMSKYDKDKSGKLHFEEYLNLCRSLAGGKGKIWDSLFFKAAVVVLLKTVVIPYTAKGVKEGIKAAGYEKAGDKLPASVVTLGVEVLAKANLPLPL